MVNHNTAFDRKSYIIGDKGFYLKLFGIVLPIILQNTLTNVVGLLDNVMVGQTGTLPMSAVAIVSSLLFVFMLCIFGGLSGAGIYGAQYFGSGDKEGFKNVFRVKLLIVGSITLIGLLILGLFGTQLADLYISADTSALDREIILGHAEQYLHIMMLGYIPFALTQVYSGTLRETGQTVIPMAASIIAMIVNFFLNLILIFGLLGFPALGVVGAAIATDISRIAELAIVGIWAHKGTDYLAGAYRSFKVPLRLLYDVLQKAFPLLANEGLWSLAEVVLLQMYSTRGIQAVAAININNTAAQIFNEMFLSIGVGTGIIIGQQLGSEDYEEAVRSSWRIVFLSIAVCACAGLVLASAAPVIPTFYKTEQEIRDIAKHLLIVSAVVMPLRGVTNAAYFTIRSGGQVFLTILFDSCFSWIVVIPAAFIIGHFTNLPIVGFYFACSSLELLKCGVAIVFLKRRKWVKTLVR